MMYLTRNAVIARLRDFLVEQAGEDHSICMVAARKGIFCKGFAQFTEEQLRAKFDWIARRRPHLDRAQLEDVIDKYKVARAEALGVACSCDAGLIDRDTCMGWDEFSDRELARFHEEWLGEKVELIDVDWHAPHHGEAH